MKKILLVTGILLSSFFSVYAQDETGVDEEKQKERVKALYVAFVTKQLDLTADEAQKFWPVHTQFENEIRAVKKDLPELEKQQAVLNIKKKFQGNFSNIIGANRCERFFRVDGEFKRKLLERLRNKPRRPAGGGVRRGGGGT
jgi:hypothetical protein